MQEETKGRTWTEAPASLTIRFDYQGFDTMLTLRGENGSEILQTLDVATAWLHEHGVGGEGNGNSNGVPKCPTHGTPMQRSKHGKGWFCPVKVADDDGTGKPVYCKQTVKDG